MLLRLVVAALLQAVVMSRGRLQTILLMLRVGAIVSWRGRLPPILQGRGRQAVVVGLRVLLLPVCGRLGEHRRNEGRHGKERWAASK